MLVLICFEFCPLYRDTCTYILNVVISSTKQLESRPSYRTIHKNSSKHHNKNKKGLICVYKYALSLFNLNLFLCDVVIAVSHSFVYSNRKSYFRSQSYTWLHTTNGWDRTHILYSKTVPWFSPMHKERNELCIMYLLIHGSVL